MRICGFRLENITDFLACVWGPMQSCRLQTLFMAREAYYFPSIDDLRTRLLASAGKVGRQILLTSCANGDTTNEKDSAKA